MTRHSIALGLALFAAAAFAPIAACSSSSGPGFQGDDGGGSSSSGAGSSSSSGSASGSSSGSSGGSSGSSSSSSSSSTSGSSGASSGGSSSSADASLDALLDVAPPPPYDGGPQPCGTQPGASLCSLKTQTCCVSQFLVGTCVNHGQSCPANTAGFGCLGKIDCASSGQVCCGVANTTSANTACQTVAPGQCQPTQSSPTMGSAQLCITSAECPSGVQCYPQSCVSGTNLKLCGLHPSAPFSCSQTGPPL